ncbi:hypothetical protein [Selenomonas ruminantium]|nr:hypothetical protein [Selenomonas ruminantium]
MGILFSAVASTLPSIALLAALTGCSYGGAAVMLLLLFQPQIPGRPPLV